MLYKYLGPDRVDILFNLKIRFSQPSALNDPFESAFLINMQSYEQEFLRTNEADFFAFMQEQGWDTSDAEISEAMKEALQNIREHTSQAMSPSAAGKILAEQFNRAQGVLSLSRVHDNLLMWAHYSNSHRGFVIGLDDAHPFFHKEDWRGDKSYPRNVVYSSLRAVTEPSAPDSYEQFLCRKSIEWAYEEEVRIFRTFGSNKAEFYRNVADKVHLFAIPPECIKQVFIGANASPVLRQKILEFIRMRRLKVEVFDACISDERYEMKFHKIATQSIGYRAAENYLSADSYMASHQIREACTMLGNAIVRVAPP